MMIAGLIMSKIKDVIDERFGRLVVFEEKHISGELRRVSCKCDCGNIKEKVLLSHLRSGKIVSCGCYRLERVKEVNSVANTKHGMYGSRPYSIWNGMLDRTIRSKPSSKDWKNYVGKGVTCDKRWESFENFWEDMRDGYSDDLELDRIDANGDYCKENCRWATPSLQSYNKRKQTRNTSGRTGVTFDMERSKWIAVISKDYISYYLGRFDSFEEAVKAREEAELYYYGEIKID